MSKTKTTFEARLQRLQEIVSALESGSLPLEDSVAMYKEGLALARSCREQLEKAQNEVRLLSEGEFKTFTPEAETEYQGG